MQSIQSPSSSSTSSSSSASTTSLAVPWQCFRFGLIALTIAYIVSQPVDCVRPPPPMIVVNKCCRIGEQLNNDRRCLVGGTEKWWPNIYLLLKEKLYIPKGDAPRFLKVREQYIPVCENMDLVTGVNKVVLFSNGSLLVSERGKFIDRDNYCIDQDAALVCLPRPHGADTQIAPITLTKINKCCPGNHFVYDENSKDKCIPLTTDHELFARKIVSNATSIDLLFTFPKCKNSDGYTIAGRFNEDSLETSTGSLTLDSSRQFQSSEYCLEHDINQLDSSTVNVFICAEHFTDKSSPSNQVRDTFVFGYRAPQCDGLIKIQSMNFSFHLTNFT